MIRVEPIKVTINLPNYKEVNKEEGSEEEYIFIDERVTKLKKYLDSLSTYVLSCDQVKGFLTMIGGKKPDFLGFINYERDTTLNKAYKNIINAYDALWHLVYYFSNSLLDIKFNFINLSEQELLDNVDIYEDLIPSNVMVNKCKVNLCYYFTEDQRNAMIELLGIFGIQNVKNDLAVDVKNTTLLSVIRDISSTKYGHSSEFSLLMNTIPSGLSISGSTTIVFREHPYLKTGLLKNEYTGFEPTKEISKRTTDIK